MYWNPRRPPATAGRGRRSLVRALLVFFLSLGLLSGICLFVSPKPQTDSFYQAVSQPVAAVSSAFALPGCVTPGLPQDAATSSVTHTTQRLSSGRLMLIDRLHPLPQEAAAPNTFNILSYSHGTITCRDLQAVLGADTLSALDGLFAAARQNHIHLFTVFRGSVSPTQQKQLQIERFCQLANALPLEDALAQTLQETSPANASEHQTGWAVDIRICDGWDQLPRSEPLSASAEGQWLLENSWRFGLIHRYPENDPSPDPSCGAYHFRYVGKAHAAMMHALSLSLEAYLDLLHTHSALTLWDETGAPVCSVLCQPVDDGLTVQAPMEAQLEDVSLDNLGWGVAAYLWPA